MLESVSFGRSDVEGTYKEDHPKKSLLEEESQVICSDCF